MLSLHPQRTPCGPGEAYRPTSVDIILRRQEVLLRDPSGRVVERAPTASDLWRRATGGYYLDLPGDPLNPRCGYAKQFRAWNDGRKPSVYAHIATDPADPGKMAVEYWFYYTFNDFTDKHESDWEMAQVDFDAPNASEALLKGPYEVDLSQHAGGERSAWTDAKLEKQGTHPVIYDATGSHANYFGRELYLGRGAREGFGCDDTRRATTRLQLQTVLLPDIVPSSAAAPYAWLAFEGRWGQKEKGINNGPTGPAAKPQWSAPIQWAAGLRNTSLELPGGRTLGVSVGGFFCGAVTAGATVLDWSLIHPLPFIALLLLILGGVLGAAAATSVAATRSASAAAAPRGRSDLPSDDARLRSEPTDLRRGGRDLHSRLSRRRRDPVGGLSSLQHRAPDSARRPTRRGNRLPGGVDRRHRRPVRVGHRDRRSRRHPG